MNGHRFDANWQSAYFLPPGTEGPGPHLISQHITGIKAASDGADVPDALIAPLFGASDAAYTYALIDGARAPGLVETLETSRLEHASLFLDGRDGLSPAAPWLVRLEPQGKFTRNLFRQSQRSWHLWGRDSFILLRSAASMPDLVAHFRRFTKVRDQQGRMVFFRFWDPLVIALYATAKRHEATRLEQIFGLPGGETVEFIVPLAEDEALHLALAPDFSRQQPRRAINFDAGDEAIMQDIAFSTFARQLLPWLAAEYPGQLATRPPADQRAIARHVIATGRRAGLDMKEDFAFLAQIMMTSGGWFWDDETPAEARQLIADAPQPKAQHLADAYAGIQAKTPQAELLSHWPELRDWLVALPEDQAITPESFRKLTTQFMPRSAGRIAGAIASTRARLREVALSDQRIEGQAVVLTLLLGPRFFEDPLKPWAGLPPEAAIAAAWREIVE